MLCLMCGNCKSLTGRSSGLVTLMEVCFITVILRVKVCNPNEGDIIKANVTNVNKWVFLLAGVGDPPPLNILLPAQYHLNNPDFHRIQPGDTLDIKGG